MKKILTLTAATAMLLASCANEETVQVNNNGKAIGFDSYVGKVTRAGDVTTETLDKFYVYGGFTAEQFKATEITKDQGTWTYSPKEYWETGKTYKFAAVSPQVDASYDLTTLTVSNYAAGTNDLIVATANATAAESDNQPVQFTFKHALAKVQFTFKSGSETVTVTNPQVSGVNSVANLAVTAGTSGTEIEWKNAGTPKEYSAASAIYVLPQTVTENMVLTFTYDDENYTVNLNTASATVPAWENGKSYSYNVNLITPASIEFSADVAAWTNTDAPLYPEASEGEEETDPQPGEQEPEEPGEEENTPPTVILACINDTWVRESSPTETTRGTAEKLELQEDGSDPKTKRAAFMGFEYNIPQGAEILEANLCFVTERYRGSEVTLYKYGEFDETSTSWNSEKENITKLISDETSPDKIITFTPAGERTNTIYEFEKLKEENKTLDKWINSIDVTDYVKTITGTSVNFMFYATGGQTCFFSKDNKGQQNALDGQTNLTNEQLKPYISVTYKVEGN